VPDLTITRLGPGWLCQPNVPPGAMTFSTMWTSVAPLAEFWIFQKSLAAPGSTSVWALAWIPLWKVPMTGDHGGFVTPEGGVAIATPAYAVVPASPRANAQISLRPMFRSLR